MVSPEGMPMNPKQAEHRLQTTRPPGARLQACPKRNWPAPWNQPLPLSVPEKASLILFGLLLLVASLVAGDWMRDVHLRCTAIILALGLTGLAALLARHLWQGNVLVALALFLGLAFGAVPWRLGLIEVEVVDGKSYLKPVPGNPQCFDMNKYEAIDRSVTLHVGGVEIFTRTARIACHPFEGRRMRDYTVPRDPAVDKFLWTAYASQPAALLGVLWAWLLWLCWKHGIRRLQAVELRT
ncbi:hypothetical protein AYO44_06440 [Planctomycetaceae bacterium SCGC AG-212-F19]|nr:hypothetical protein AYO44_06440 [Planctomycetaceae bacterium SCGC AG-212-F19]